MVGTVDWESRIGRRLRLRDLHIFFAVVQTGSMAKAAAHLRVTQPSVSKAIGDLEAALGVQLFDRSPSGVEPTMYGDALIECGSAVFDELRLGIRKIEFLADPTVGELRIGCVDSITVMTLPTVIQNFSRQYPRVALRVDDVPSLSAQLLGLRDRIYDFTLARMDRALTDEENDVNVEILFNEDLAVVAGSGSRWARRRKIDIAELFGEQWVLTPPDTPNYACLAEAFRARGLGMPKASLVSLSAPLRAHLLAEGQYITIFPTSALQYNAERYGLKVLPVALPNRPWPIVILTLKNRTLSPVTERFIACAREVVKGLMKGRPRA